MYHVVNHKTGRSRKAFTLIEMLVVISIIAVLSSLVTGSVNKALQMAKATASCANLRQLGMATIAYATDHQGNYPAGMSRNNLVRWHGSRSSISSPFEAGGGYLSPYLGADGRIKRCPLLGSQAVKNGSFEVGAGGYGYNSAYLGGRYVNGDHVPFNCANISNFGSTLLFSTTAFANKSGVQEYPFSEPYTSPGGSKLQPSTHFRANGKALVAWGDGHVSREKPNAAKGPNYYGGSNSKQQIGWFGPEKDNGYWNPYPAN